MPGDQTWIGAPADVVLPLVANGTGKVFATRAGRTQELLARPFDDSAEHPERWTNVLILDIRDGIALVAPNDMSLDPTAAPDGDPRLGAPDGSASTEI
jgi:hypothetical protein